MKKAEPDVDKPSVDQPDGKTPKLIGKISDVFGLLKTEGQRVLSIEEINDLTPDGWAGKR